MEKPRLNRVDINFLDCVESLMKCNANERCELPRRLGRVARRFLRAMGEFGCGGQVGRQTVEEVQNRYLAEMPTADGNCSLGFLASGPPGGLPGFDLTETD